MIVYRVKFPEGFKDGNVYPEQIPPGGIVQVDEQTYLKMRQSEPGVELIERLVPNPKKSKQSEKA